MTSKELIAWSSLHERRSRSTWSSPWTLALVAGLALGGWVLWRAQVDPVAGSRAWLAGTLLAFAVAFMRVPFHLYWRADAALLAQLPIEGGPLFDAALRRCVRAGAATTLATAVGALPLLAAEMPFEIVARHLAVAGALGLTAMLFMPAVATYAAAIVAASQSEGMAALRTAAGAQAAPPSTALLGALPGFAATVVIVAVLIVNRWLIAESTPASPALVLGLLAGASVAAIAGARAMAGRVMGTILRDVSALDRQHLATLEIRPPTSIERAIAKLIGDGALPYAKDARLMRRRYPMAFALGALVFLVLAIVGLAQPDAPTPWLTATLAGATVYGLSVGARLFRPPIELPRHSASLPIEPAARKRAKVAWVAGWWLVFVLVPGLIASLRQPDPVIGLALLGGGTLVVLGGVLARR